MTLVLVGYILYSLNIFSPQCFHCVFFQLQGADESTFGSVSHFFPISCGFFLLHFSSSFILFFLKKEDGIPQDTTLFFPYWETQSWKWCQWGQPAAKLQLLVKREARKQVGVQSEILHRVLTCCSTNSATRKLLNNLCGPGLMPEAYYLSFVCCHGHKHQNKLMIKRSISDMQHGPYLISSSLPQLASQEELRELTPRCHVKADFSLKKSISLF